LDPVPAGYGNLLIDVKRRINDAQIKAAISVNRELVGLHWDIGRLIAERQQVEGWGKSTVDRLSADLRSEFPNAQGFSAQNLWFMRGFFLAWTRDVQILQQPVGELDGEHLPQVVSVIPWGHNIQLLTKLKDPAERLWYARQTIEHGWSRNILIHQIESDLYHRQGGAISNFHATLPAPQSDLAHQLLKDPYVFDFLSLTGEAQERELEQSLIDQVEKMLLEFGHGFALMGRQYHLKVGSDDFYLDLLFYHHQLRCLVVVDLKVEKFKPEFAGKMQFYLSAVDDLVRHPDDLPSIGLIICKERDRVIVEYALRDARKPIGVAEYVWSQVLPEQIQRELPLSAELEARITDVKEGR